MGLSRRSRKRFYPSPNSSAKRVDLGSPELTRLWNLGVDNMEACCSQDRCLCNILYFTLIVVAELPEVHWLKLFIVAVLLASS